MPSSTGARSEDAERTGWLAVEAERLAAAGRFRESERLLGRLLAVQEAAVAGRELDLAVTLGMRGEVRFLSDDAPGAEDDFRRALAIRERCLGRRHLDTACSLCSLALLLWRRGDPRGAEPLLSRCLDVRRTLLGDDHPETVGTQARLKRLWRELCETEDDMAATERDETETLLDFSGSVIVSEWTALRDRFGTLSRRLLDAAQQGKTGAADSVVQELTGCRLGFRQLCDEARGWAEAFRVPCPPPAELENLVGIGTFLDTIGDAVLTHDRAERPRRRALLVLDQVLRLAHAREPQFAPLAACQERARALYRQLGSVTPGEDDLRPFYDLLVLAHQRDALSDETWYRTHQRVTAAFGKALAAAATRGNLVPSLAVVHAFGEPVQMPIESLSHPGLAWPMAPVSIDPTVPVAPPAPPVIGGPLSVAAQDAPAARSARLVADPSPIRFRTADGKLYTLMPAEPAPGPKSQEPSPAAAGVQ